MRDRGRINGMKCLRNGNFHKMELKQAAFEASSVKRVSERVALYIVSHLNLVFLKHQR